MIAHIKTIAIMLVIISFILMTMVFPMITSIVVGVGSIAFVYFIIHQSIASSDATDNSSNY